MFQDQDIVLRSSIAHNAVELFARGEINEAECLAQITHAHLLEIQIKGEIEKYQLGLVTPLITDAEALRQIREAIREVNAHYDGEIVCGPVYDLTITPAAAPKTPSPPPE